MDLTEGWQSLVDCTCFESSRGSRHRRFKSFTFRLCLRGRMAMRQFCKLVYVGSIPTGGSYVSTTSTHDAVYTFLFLNKVYRGGEWPVPVNHHGAVATTSQQDAERIS